MAKTTDKAQQKSVAITIKEFLVMVVGVLVPVLVVQNFIAAGFVIPTGSMADTLRGDHFHLTCPTCGNEYNFGFIPGDYLDPRTNYKTAYPNGYRPGYPLHISNRRLKSHGSGPICPLCGTPALDDVPQYVNRGDQIWVIKCFYHLYQPKNWEVFVFKNPTIPQQNYIKRLIGLPNQTVELIDGDVYIDGVISEKPDKVQDVLWLPVFDNDYQPSDEQVRQLAWKQPFSSKMNTASPWKLNQHGREFKFIGSEKGDTLNFEPRRIHYTTANLCAYNGNMRWDGEISSDLKLSFVLTPDEANGKVQVMLEKYNRQYIGEIGFDGQIKIVWSDGEIVTGQKIEPLEIGKPIDVSFENVDHKLVVRVGDEKIVYKGPNDAAEWGYEEVKGSRSYPDLSLTGVGGAFTLEHVRVFRDTHYLNSVGNTEPGVGTEGHPVKLGENEYFALGDNSPMSLDGRFWAEEGYGNDGKRYPRGVVPGEYLIGKPLCVYWPAGYRPDILGGKIPFVPNFGEFRFIY